MGSILSHRFLRNNKTEFLVKWVGCGPEHNTWEPEANCANCPQVVSDYWDRVKAQQATYKPGKRSLKRKNSRRNDTTVVGTRRSTRRRT